MDQQNRKLIEAKRTGYQTAEIASSTANEMYRQTDVLSRNKERVRTILVSFQITKTSWNKLIVILENLIA